MKVLNFLKKLAANAKLIKIVEEAESEKDSLTGGTTTISLSQLISARDKGLDGQLNARELNIPFDEIYTLFKITTPENGWNVDHVIKFLSAESIEDMNSEKAKEFLKEALVKNNLSPQAIIKDAINRDKTLDSYEQFAHQKLEERAKIRREEKESLERRIEESNKALRQLDILDSKDQDSFQQWIVKKIEKEEELVKVVRLLTTDSIISLGQVTPNNNKGK